MRVPLEAPAVVVPGGPAHAEINTAVAFTGTLLGNGISGEFTFEGGNAETGVGETAGPSACG